MLSTATVLWLCWKWLHLRCLPCNMHLFTFSISRQKQTLDVTNNVNNTDFFLFFYPKPHHVCKSAYFHSTPAPSFYTNGKGSPHGAASFFHLTANSTGHVSHPASSLTFYLLGCQNKQGIHNTSVALPASISPKLYSLFII